MAHVVKKDPGDTEDYIIDLAPKTNGRPKGTDYLAAGETIDSVVVTADTGITADAGTLTDTNTSVTVRVSGGTAGEEYDIVVASTLSTGRIKERTITVLVEQA